MYTNVLNANAMVCVWFIHFKITLLKLKISEGPVRKLLPGPVLALDGPDPC